MKYKDITLHYFTFEINIIKSYAIIDEIKITKLYINKRNE